MNTTRPPDTEVDDLPDVLSGELLILKAAYRAAEQPDAQPSAAVDDALRAAARRAVHAGPEVPLTRSFFHFPTYATPLAAAAVIVLAVSVGFLSLDDPMMRRNLPPEPPIAVSVVPPQRELPPPQSVAPAPPAAETARAANSNVNEARVAAPAATSSAKRETGPVASAPLSSAQVVPAPTEQLASPAAAYAEKAGPPAVASPAAKAAPSVAAASVPAEVSASAAQKSSTARTVAAPADALLAAKEAASSASPPAAASPAPPPAAAPQSAPVVARAAAAPAAPPSPPAPPAPVASASPAPPNRDIVLAEANDPRLKGLAKRDRYEQPVAAASVPQPSSPLNSPKVVEPRAIPDQGAGARNLEAAAKEAPSSSQVVTQNAALKDSAAEQQRSAQTTASLPASAAVKSAASTMPARPATPALRVDEADPKAWLVVILHLKATGQDKQAAEQLKRFRERYPDHPLPSALKEKDAK